MVVSNESSLNCLTKVLPVSPLPPGHIKSCVFNASIFLSSYLHLMLQHVCLWARYALSSSFRRSQKVCKCLLLHQALHWIQRYCKRWEQLLQVITKPLSKSVLSVPGNIQCNFQVMIHLTWCRHLHLNQSFQALLIGSVETKTVFFQNRCLEWLEEDLLPKNLFLLTHCNGCNNYSCWLWCTQLNFTQAR